MGFFDKIKDIMTDDTDDFDEYYDNSESLVKPPRRREREERETVPEREEVVCAKNYYDTDRAMIFTNSELTPQADEAAKKLGVVVCDGAVICR